MSVAPSYVWKNNVKSPDTSVSRAVAIFQEPIAVSASFYQTGFSQAVGPDNIGNQFHSLSTLPWLKYVIYNVTGSRKNIWMFFGREFNNVQKNAPRPSFEPGSPAPRADVLATAPKRTCTLKVLLDWCPSLSHKQKMDLYTFKKKKKNFLPAPRLEPGSPAWKVSTLTIPPRQIDTLSHSFEASQT